MTLDLNGLSTRDALTAVYIGYYDRAADPSGIQFWEQVIADTSLSLEEVASDFAGQDETAEVHPFFADPDSTSASTFITVLYQNLFNRDPDEAGLTFYTEALEAAVAGEEGAISVGQIILLIIGGAQDVEGGAQDQTTILNKIAAASDWTTTAEEVADLDFSGDVAQSAKTIIESVDDSAESVEAAAATVDGFFDLLINPPAAGGVISLAIGDGPQVGDSGDDLFIAGLAQNAFGGIANTMSSATNLDGKGGYDTLEAVVSNEFLGLGSGGIGLTDIQPTLSNIEEISIEARDGDFQFGGFVTFDAKDVTDVEVIGSHNSDGDLIIENLTTLTSDGVARNTSDITISMDHTDNFNSDGDASDLIVYFDNDYLINDAPLNSGASLTIELMDLDAETVGDDPLLDNPFGLITFNFGDQLKTLDFGTDSDTYAELLADIQAAITLAAETDPDFGQLSARFGVDFTVRDTDADPNPARPDLTGRTIEIVNSGPEELEAVTMRATGDAPAGKDFHTGFDNEAPDTEEFPISVDIDLHKAGRGGQGGDLVVGGKAQEVSEGIEGGITVFNVSVLGEGAESTTAGAEKPSNIGTLTSTLGALETVNIVTDEAFVDGDTFASLEIRDGFNTAGAFGETGDLMLVDANGFLGDLFLGTNERIVNLDTLTALGGGDVTYNALLNGAEAGDATLFTPEDYTVLTGAGDDTVDIAILTNSVLDFAGSSLEVKTGDGDDAITLNMADFLDGELFIAPFVGLANQQLNQAVLDNVDIDGEGGNDTIDVDGLGNANIMGGAGDDVIYTDGAGAFAVWATNFDNVRVDDSTGNLGGIAADEIPGEQLTTAYIGGAVLTVTLSGAGVMDAADGGGVMALPTAGAVQGDDGYESRVTVNVAGENTYYGTEADINDAVIRAIEGDATLNALLSVVVGPNNTLLITSKTSGDFDATDLRIDIAQRNADSTSYANAVLDEAREVTANSDWTLTDLWGGTTFTTARSYESTAPGALTSSDTANDFYDGLSVRGGSNEMDDNLHTAGTASTQETDNVINGGADNDIIVLSTDAVPGSTLNYTPGGNNSMLDGSSNETVVMEDLFGDDVVMNFTTTGAAVRTSDVTQTIATIAIDTQGSDAVVATEESFTLDVNPVPESGADYTIDFDGAADLLVEAGDDPMTIAATIAAGTFTNYTAVDNLDGTVTFTAITTGNVPDIGVNNFNAPDVFDENATITTTDGTSAVAAVAEVFTMTFADAVTGGSITGLDGANVIVSEGDTALTTAAAVAASGVTGFTAVDNLDGTVTFTADTAGAVTDLLAVDFGGLEFMGTVTSTIPAGIDFLDFTSYLTSMEDQSVNGAGSTDSDVSNNFIPVTLDDDLSDVQANEVSIVQFDNTPTADSFAGLTASVMESLFNGSAVDDDYGTFDASSINADDEYGSTATTDDLIGMAKSIVMVENADDLGYYKVFELEWDGNSTADTGSTLNGMVSAELIGTLDFGTSLTDITAVNLVGTEEYGDLLADGILA